MKSRLGNWNSSASLDSSSIESKKIEEEDDENPSSMPEQKQQNDFKPIPPESQRKSDLSKALDNHVDKLDSMLEKADNAHYSMQHQRKQMQSFLK